MDEVKIGIANDVFIQPTVYYLLDCPAYIENEVWGECIQFGGSREEIKMFHSTWLVKLEEVCKKYNVQIKLIQ